MQLSPHFSLKELTDSDKARELKLDNTASPKIVNNLCVLSSTLEDVRKLLGKPVVISSGYRSPSVNKAVGGSSTSMHEQGLAADIKVEGMTPYQVACAIRDSGIVLDQLICEPTWVHIGLSLGKPREQYLTMKRVNGKTVYLNGIVK